MEFLMREYEVTLFAKVALRMKVMADDTDAAIDAAYDELSLQDPESMKMTIVKWLEGDELAKPTTVTIPDKEGGVH